MEPKIKIQAANDVCIIKQEEAVNEVGGLLLPDDAKKKTNFGVLLSVGELVQDRLVRKSIGKRVAFHSGIGFTISDDGEDYLILRGNEILYVK